MRVHIERRRGLPLRMDRTAVDHVHRALYAGGPPRAHIRDPLCTGNCRHARGSLAAVEALRPGQYLKLIASGDVDAILLGALEDFVKRRKKRLESEASKANAASGST